METTAISPGSTNPRTAPPRGFAGLDGDDFFKLLVAQLSNQDPLEPTSNQELLNQISSIRDIEASTTLTRTLESLVERQGLGSATGLIGQYVSGTAAAADGSSGSTSGMVVGLRVDPNGIVLLLEGGEELPMSDVDHVTSAREFAEALRGRLVRGMDRSDPANPSRVEGIVTGVTTGSDGQVMLELDNGQALRLTDLTVGPDSAPGAASQAPG